MDDEGQRPDGEEVDGVPGSEGVQGDRFGLGDADVSSHTEIILHRSPMTEEEQQRFEAVARAREEAEKAVKEFLKGNPTKEEREAYLEEQLTKTKRILAYPPSNFTEASGAQLAEMIRGRVVSDIDRVARASIVGLFPQDHVIPEALRDQITHIASDVVEQKRANPELDVPVEIVSRLEMLIQQTQSLTMEELAYIQGVRSKIDAAHAEEEAYQTRVLEHQAALEPVRESALKRVISLAGRIASSVGGHTKVMTQELKDFASDLHQFGWSSDIVQKACAELVVLIDNDVIPNIDAATKKALMAVYVRYPMSRLATALVPFLEQLISRKLSNGATSIRDELVKKLEELREQAGGDPTTDEARCLEDVLDEIGHDGGGIEASLPIQASEHGDRIPPLRSPDLGVERGDGRPGAFGIFTQRVSVIDDLRSFMHTRDLRRAEGESTRFILDDSDAVEEAKRILAGIHGHEKHYFITRDSRGELVAFFEFDASDETECEKYGERLQSLGGRSGSLLVALLRSRAKEDFTPGELSALRTFDQRDITLPGEEPFILEHLNTSSAFRDITLEERTARYDDYRKNLILLLHRLNAYADAEEDAASKIDKKTAEGVVNRLDVLIETLRREWRVADTTSVVVRRRGEMSDRSPKPMTFQDAIEKDIKPLIEAIDTVVPQFNTINDAVHNTRKSIEDVLASARGIDARKVILTVRSNEDFDEGIALYSIAWQIEIARHGRIIGVKFGERVPPDDLEPAEERVIGMMAALWLQRNPTRKLGEREKAWFRYVARFASGFHKGFSGEYWNIPADDGEMLTGTNATGKQDTTYPSEIGPVAEKFKNLSTVYADGEAYKNFYRVAKGVPIPRIFGHSPRIRVQSGEVMRSELEKPFFEEMRSAIVDSHRKPGSSIARYRRSNLYLPDVFKKQAGDPFVSGKDSVPQLTADIYDSFEKTGSHAHAIGIIREKWGDRGVINYIDTYLMRMMEEDPEFAQEVIDEKRRRERVNDGKSDGRARTLFGGRSESLIERFIFLKDKARAKYLALHVVKPILEYRQSRALALDNSAFSVHDGLSLRAECSIMLLPRDEGERIHRSGEFFAESRLTETQRRHFLFCEMYCQLAESILPGETIRSESIHALAQAAGIEVQITDTSRLETLHKVAKHFRAGLIDIVSRRKAELLAQFSYGIALNQGSYQAQMTAGAPYSELEYDNRSFTGMSGIEARTTIRKEIFPGLFGESSVLKGISPTSPAEAMKAAQDLVEGVIKASERLTSNREQQLRVRAQIACLITAIVMENGKDRVFTRVQTVPAMSKSNLRFIFLYNLLRGCRVPEDEYMVGENNQLTLAPVRIRDVIESYFSSFSGAERSAIVSLNTAKS